MQETDPARRCKPAWPRYWYGAFTLVSLVSACNPEIEAVRTGPLPVATISVSPSDLELPVGSTLRLNVTLADPAGNILPDRPARPTLLTPAPEGEPVSVMADSKGRSGRIVTWISSHPRIATVDAAGLVSAIRAGEANITALSEGRTAATRVVVTEPSDGAVSTVPARASLFVGDSLQLAVLHRDISDAAGGVTWEAQPPTRVSVRANGRVTAVTAGEVTITATDGRHDALAELTIKPVTALRGLNFPGNAGTTDTMRFEFTSPLPAYPATYIWRAYLRQQQSYYTAFFWGNSKTFYPSHTYYGFHPYPDWNTDYQHFWEIATPPGSDIVSSSHVVYDRWYVQVAVCRMRGDETILEFYWDWPDMSKVIRHTGRKVSDPPNPALVVGDAPWNAGNEVWDGVLRGFQFYDAALTPDEVAQEIVSPGSVRMPWYLNLNPSPEDVSDMSGNGNDPEWIGGERPTLWTGKESEGGAILTGVDPR